MINRFLLSIVAVVLSLTSVTAKQNVVVISKCGGVDTVIIPSITDNDLDGMDDALEQKLLNRFMPVFIQFDDESCPGPALNGTGDSNLVVCHIYPFPQQYTFSNSLDSVLTHPVTLVPKKGLVTGLIWYEPLININAALLYGKDCGLAGHTADVEGFTYSLKYIGNDSVAGWMYDTIMQHWMGGMIQTISHEGTLCEQVETYPYKSSLFPTGKDTIYASPDKHGNYLTISGCGASFICNPGCGGIPSVKNIRAINIGEESAPLVTDLGSLYPAYAGNNPWGTSNFLSANGGNAGAIRTKMLFKLQDGFAQGTTLNSQSQICNIYSQCFSSGSTFSDYTCTGAPYSFYNQQLIASGTYYHTLTSSYGCDSTIALALTVLPVSNYSYNTSVCNGSDYNFNGTMISSPGVYYDTLSNVNGCDSIVTLTLNVNSTNNFSYSTSVCSGNTYTFNSQQLSSSGFYVDTLVNSSGCDSIVQLTLVVDTLPPVIWNFNADTIPSGSHPVLLTGGSPSGGTYSGSGVYGNLFFPDSAGYGSHTLTYTYTDAYGCSGTVLRTFTVLISGIKEMEIGSSISIYPNPAYDKLNFIYPETNEILTLTIYDVRGAEVRRTQLKGISSSIDISELSSDVYALRFVSGSQTAIKKLIVE